MTLFTNMSNASNSLDGPKSTTRGKQWAAIVGTSSSLESPLYVGVLYESNYRSVVWYGY